MSPQQHPDGEGPVDREQARKNVKDWFDKPEHGRKFKDVDRDETTRDGDLKDPSMGGGPNGPE